MQKRKTWETMSKILQILLHKPYKLMYQEVIQTFQPHSLSCQFVKL